jgi:glucose/arabinose dehydrogenase
MAPTIAARAGAGFLAVLALAACSSGPALPPQAGYGPDPQLPAPRHQLIPTVKVANATGWLAGGAPRSAAGLRVTAFAAGLDHPRWLYLLPDGDVLVAETNAPAKKEPGGIKAWVMKLMIKKAGAGAPSPDRIVLLRDADGDGVAETRSVFLDGLYSPFGMTLTGSDLYVANTDAIVRFPYRAGETRITARGVRLTDLPGLPIDHHWTKNIIASPDGARLYATVGSNSNVGENGMAAEAGRAAIWEVDRATGAKRLYATGLRNPNGLGWEGGRLWTVVNERDELGNDLVPDYLTSVRDGGFYGWPYSYWGQTVDERVKAQRPDLVARAIRPDYGLGSHVAALGLAFGRGELGWGEGAYVGLHGSWNRSPRVGYKVIFVPFADGRPAGPPRDVLTGFLGAGGEALGRPVGVAFDRAGALLVADDVGGVVWRVSAGAPTAPPPPRG